MQIKFLSLITFTILINNSFPLQQVENQSRSIKILPEEKTHETESINETMSTNETTRLINNSYANEATVIKTRSIVKGQNGKMGMLSPLPLVLIFGTKAIFFEKESDESGPTTVRREEDKQHTEKKLRNQLGAQWPNRLMHQVLPASQEFETELWVE